MKQSHTVSVTEERERLDFIKCELCERTTQDSENWAEGCAVDEVVVTYQSGNNYGTDGGELAKSILDICPDCFLKKLLPWFKAQGGTVRTEESNW